MQHLTTILEMPLATPARASLIKGEIMPHTELARYPVQLAQTTQIAGPVSVSFSRKGYFFSFLASDSNGDDVDA